MLFTPSLIKPQYVSSYRRSLTLLRAITLAPGLRYMAYRYSSYNVLVRDGVGISGVLEACPLMILRTVPKFAEENCKAITSYRGYVGSGVSKANTVSLSFLTDMPDVGESLIHAMPLPMVACISLPVTEISKLSAA